MQARVGIGGFKQDRVCLDHVELVTLEQKLEKLREPALALWGGAIPVQGTARAMSRLGRSLDSLPGRDL